MQDKTVVYGEVISTPHTEHAGAHSLAVFDWLYRLVCILFWTILENFRLKAELIGLRERNKELEEENQKLYEQAHTGSDTSSIPPNKDWKRSGGSTENEETDDQDVGKAGKETPISITDYLNKDKDGGKKRPGGQKGHSPTSMHVNGAQERDPVFHYPDKCVNCPHFDQCKKEDKFQVYSTSTGYDIEIILVCRQHVLFEARECKDDEQRTHNVFPEIIGSRFYDINIQLLVITWHHIFYGSYDRIGLAAKELFGLSLSAGTANAIVQRVSERILSSGFIDAIRFFILLFETLLGVDETSAHVAGRNAWVHTSVTTNVTLLIAHWRRGFEGTIYAGVLQFYIHTFISDCWASYFNETFKCIHAICNGHILRELVAAAYFRKQSWAIEMFDLLLEIFEAKRDAIENSEKSLPQEYLDDIRTRYHKIVEGGFNENAGVTKGKTISLLERLKKLEDAVLAFAVDFSVDFTNNASEQSIRNLKVVLRVIGQFKTMAGLADYCIIQSFMDTCRKLGHNPFDMLKILLSGGDIIDAVFGAEKAAQIKQMIRLTDAFAEGDENKIESITAGITFSLTDELLAAASNGRFKTYNEPPPEKKNSSSVDPKDKMQAARVANALKKPAQATTAPSADLPQNTAEDLRKKKKQQIRAGPESA